MNGWTGKIARIDLSRGTIAAESPPADIYLRYVGGKGMAGFYLREHITRNWDDPLMPLVFFTGPLVGTPSPTSGRMAVMSRSPLTGTVGDASVGGAFGTELKRAGWDGIIITGESGFLCGIEIADGDIRIVDTSTLKGMDVARLKDILAGKGASAAIGPAAENGVRFSAIIFDGHFAAGRGGLGCVLAAKNLKYITVKGSGKVLVADADGLSRAREDIFRLAAASPALMGELGIANYGTGAIYDLTASRRMMPTDNFRATSFPGAREANAYAYKKRYRPKRTGCRGCHILCKKSDAAGNILPEFETMNHFSALLGNGDIEIVVQANRICNETGMDTITAGSTLACYAELRGRALKGDEITGLLRDIAYARGEGAALGAGSYEYACAMGHPGASMSVKKLELPAYDPRGACGMALGYAVSTRGGCHLRAYPIGNEILRKPVPTDRFTFSGKARIVKIAEDVNAAADSLTACRFIFFGAGLEEYARVFTAVTGIDMTGQDLLKAGERIYYHDRIMNALNGFTAADDDLPGRFFTEPGSSGSGITIAPLNRDDFLQSRAAYYQVRGLDERGMPVKKKALELELEWNG